MKQEASKKKVPAKKNRRGKKAARKGNKEWFIFAEFTGKKITNPIDLAEIVESGFLYNAFEEFSSELDLPLNELADLIHISIETLSIRKEEGKLNSEESDRVMRIARILGLTIDLFEGDKEKAIHWLMTSKIALGGKSPMDFSKTEVGAREVESIIGRLEHGVFS